MKTPQLFAKIQDFYFFLLIITYKKKYFKISGYEYTVQIDYDGSAFFGTLVPFEGVVAISFLCCANKPSR
jgi:hypothetical protein